MEHPHYFRQLDIRIPAVYELVRKIWENWGKESFYCGAFGFCFVHLLPFQIIFMCTMVLNMNQFYLFMCTLLDIYAIVLKGHLFSQVHIAIGYLFAFE